MSEQRFASAARVTDEDVHDVIAPLRLNDDPVLAHHDLAAKG